LPIVDHHELYRLAHRFLQAAGTPTTDAARVAHALVLSDLKGVASHGVMRLPQYLEQIREGLVVPDAQAQLVRETATTAVVDGQRAFGHVVAEWATHVALDKARAHDLAAVTLYNTRHIGRVGEYVEMAAGAGLIGFAFCSALPQVVPHGGRGRILGTNPLAIGIPSDGQFPVVLDYATSALSEGKVRLARNRGAELPPGIIVDAEGQPSTRPQDLYEGGALLPLGTYKGYALNLIIQLLGSVLAQGGTASLNETAADNAALLIVLSPEPFCDLGELRYQAQSLCETVKGSPLRQGFAEILVPGEPEYRTEQERRAHGIPIDDVTWANLESAGLSIGMTADDFDLDHRP
jgi:LDH2 family malate/lactate/ureidoglycolate dehydrogenase